jgi:hypothetical protein
VTTPEHDQAETKRYTVHFPAHPERKSDPHYKDFNAFRRRTQKTAKCAIGEHRNDYSECAGGLELHHSKVEFALQNGINLVWLERDFPGISDPDTVGAWVESADNLMWLCLLPDVPIRMADGSERAISDVRVGDSVMTHDGSVQPVLATCRKPYRGEVFRIGSATLTPTHRVLTHRGWLTAAEIEREFRMHGPDVILLRCEEEQVFRGVVRPVSVDVMDALFGGQRAANHLLHNPAVLHDESRRSVAVNQDTDIALWGDRAPGSISVLPRLGVQSSHAARVGTVVNSFGSIVTDISRTSASPTNEFRMGVGVTPQFAPRCTTGATAGGIAPRETLRCKKSSFADDALALSEQGARLYGGWYALREVRRIAHAGYVHDITIANSHSFIADGTVVHNCEFHHRGHGGVHVASSSDFEAEKYIKGLIG